MPKRKESKIERWRRKIEEYEGKRRPQKRRRIVLSSSDEDEHHEDFTRNQGILPEPPPVIEASIEEILNPTETDLVDHHTATEVSAISQAGLPEEAQEELFDPELIRIVGGIETEASEWGADIHEGISRKLKIILQEGLKTSPKEELLKKYLFPKNTPFAKAPTLNPEISNMQHLTESFKTRDKHMMAKQNQMGKVIAMLGFALTECLKKNPNMTEVVQILDDCSMLLADSHFLETYTRRSMIIPLLDKSMVDLFKQRKRDEFLFGDNLTDSVKTSNVIKKTGNMLQSQSTPSTSSLNYQGPPSRGRMRSYQHTPYNRNGGQRGHYMSGARRRGPPPPPPPPPPRRLPPPPLPPRRQPAPVSARRRSLTDRQRR